VSRSFDGSGDILTGTSPLESGAHTVFAWVKPATLVNFAHVVNVRDDAGEGDKIAMISMASGIIRYYIGQGVNESQVDAGNTGTGTWVPVIGRSNGSDSHKVWNGATTATGTTASSPTGLAQLRVGDVCNGLIAHVAIWNTAIDDADVDELRGGANPLAVQSASLIGYWPLLTDASTEPDEAGANDLTVTDATHSTDNPTVDDPPGPAASSPSTRPRGGRNTRTSRAYRA
jgi:hypothetical protein